LATSAEKPFVRSLLWIVSMRKGGETPALRVTLWTLVGTIDPREEYVVAEDP